MTPKNRKSLTNCWYTCETCGVILSHKDIHQHTINFCPPSTTDWEHAFIKDKVLFSFVENFSVTDTSRLKEHEKNFFVYLSQSAMQLCQFQIGEEVLLILDSGSSYVRTVWPTTERTLTSVMVPLNPANSINLFEDRRVKVQRLPSKPMPPASLIHLTISKKMDSHSTNQLLTICKELYIGKLIQLGCPIILPFYGKTIELIVKNIVPHKQEAGDDLVCKFEDLNIDKSFSKELYFAVVDSTKWEVFENLNKELGPTSEKELTGISSVGGYKEITQELMKTVSQALKRNDKPSHFSSSLGILLHGANGVGKTFIAKAIASEMNVHTVKINSGELFSKFYGETELRLRNLFGEAKDKSPSIIILDNVDTLCPKRGGTEQERRIISYLLTLLDTLKDTQTVVLATTSHVNLIETSLRRPGRLDYEIELPIPTISDRFDILKLLLLKWDIEDSEVMSVALSAHGYVAADLQCLVTKAVLKAMSHNKTDIAASDLFWALSQIKPSAMREVLVEVPNVKWTDIGGMDDLKLKLQQAIEWPLRHPEAFSRLGISPPRGILMYGPPGCSKTMIAKALATESKLNFLSIKGSELFSKWVGESEKAVQSLFRRARAVAPSIIFLDELDALGGERSGSSEGNSVQERVLAQLLTEMDGVEPLGNVNIVAATNRPDRIDKALLRPGRLDRLVYVPLPDLATRICILQLQLVKMPVSSDIVIDDLALKTEGYSGAEVISVCHEAAMSALQEDFNVTEVCRRHFVSALEMVRPRTPPSLLKLYDTYLKS